MAGAAWRVSHVRLWRGLLSRGVLVRLHRWAGLLLAGFLTLAGLTGIPLAFNEEIDAWLNPDLYTASGHGSRPLDEIVASVERSDLDASVLGVLFPAGARSTMRVYVLPRAGTRLGYDQVFVDPATARVLGRRDTDACCIGRRALMPFLFRLHYTIAVGEIGQTVMGSMALLWAFDCFVGLALTLPRARPFFSAWAEAWRIKRSRNVFRVVYDLHRAGGLWAWLALLVVAISGFALALPSIFRLLLGGMLPLSPLPPGHDIAADPPIGFSAALSRAIAAIDVAREPIWVAANGTQSYAVALIAPGRQPEAGLGPDWVYLAADTGRVLRVDRADSGTTGDVVTRFQFPLHSGQIIGLPGQILVAVLGVVTVTLAITGVWLWMRKRFARRTSLARQRRSQR